MVDQLLVPVTSEKNKLHLYSTLDFLCYHFILELWGRSPVGNIVLSLQVVHRAKYWLPFDTAASNTDSPLLSTATQTE